MTKGIIMAGGSGTRLFPLTYFTCKQLLPVYDKPLIYYPLTTLILAGVTEILIISSLESIPVLKKALGNGQKFGITLQYEIQSEPRGIAEAYLIAEDFLDGEASVLILGDNIFNRADLGSFISQSIHANSGATIFSFPVANPGRFGVVEVDPNTNRVISLEEKPAIPKSNLAAVGLYIYDGTASEKARSLRPSERGELEITDLNKLYMTEGRLECARFSRGDFWVDAGIVDALSDASNYIRLNQSYTGKLIGSPEEAAILQGLIAPEYYHGHYHLYKKSKYASSLLSIIKNEEGKNVETSKD